MRKDYVHLSNTQAFIAGYQTVEERGASENCFMVVDGSPGYGKTSTAEWFATQNGLPFLRAKREWRATWMIRELLETMQASAQNSYEKMFRQVIEELGKRAAIARMERKPFAIVVDEADYVVGSGALIETLRDISDLIEIPIILVGMRRIKERLSHFPQVASRIEGGAHVRFQPLSEKDTRALVGGLCSCDVDEDLLIFLHQKAGGYAREVLAGLSSIERVGRRLDRPVTLSDMDGQVLLTERSTGHQIVVRAA